MSVYIPPENKKGIMTMVIIPVIATFLLFLLLPLTIGISEKKLMNLTSMDVATVAPPPPPPPQEEPEPEPEEEPEPELEEDNSMPPMSLSQLEMSLNGMGDGMGIGLNLSISSNLVNEIAVFDLGDVDSPPESQFMIPPKYPPSLQRQKITGKAVVLFILSEKGIPSNIKVESSTHELFGRSVMDAVKQWRFVPAKKSGKAVRARVRQVLQFKLS